MKLTILALATAAAATVNGQFVYTYAGPDVPIPDIGMVEVPLTVADAYPLDRLEFGILVPHTWQGDLKATLIAPWSGSIVLMDRPGSPQQFFGFSADNFGNPALATRMVFSDLGAATYDVPQVPQPGTPNVIGNWNAEGGGLDAWARGNGVGGTWVLRIEDFGGGDIGVVRSFQVRAWVLSEPATFAGLSLGLALLRRRGNPR